MKYKFETHQKQRLSEISLPILYLKYLITITTTFPFNVKVTNLHS
jgi:hypothetical protein